MLSISDFLVCTFSSQVNQQNARFLKLIIKLNFMAQVCRIAYELMQQHHVDASDRFKSLDDIWWVQLLFWRIICHDASGRQPSIFVLFRYYGGQDEHQQEAVLRHEVEGRSGEVGFSNDLSEPWVYVVPFQISLEVGDVLGVAGNHWNGFNKGRNHRTNRWVSNGGSSFRVFYPNIIRPSFNSGSACIRSTKPRKNWELSISQNMPPSKHREFQHRGKTPTWGEKVTNFKTGAAVICNRRRWLKCFHRVRLWCKPESQNKKTDQSGTPSQMLCCEKSVVFLCVWGFLFGNLKCVMGHLNFAPLYLAF